MVLKFLALFYIFLFYDWPFLHVRNLKKTYFFQNTDKIKSYTLGTLNCRYHVNGIIVSDISLKSRCFGLHFCRKKFKYNFYHFYAMRPGSYRVR